MTFTTRFSAIEYLSKLYLLIQGLKHTNQITIMKRNRKGFTAIFALSAVLAISASAQAQSSTGQQSGLTNPGKFHLRRNHARMEDHR
jgi:hypothetical protein